MDIEAIVKKFAGGLLGVTYRSAENVLRAALTEAESCMAMEHNLKMLQVESAHAIELRAYEATVANLEERVRELERSRKECEQLREAAMELKDVCNRPSAARTRAEAWRALDKAIKAAAPAKEGE